MTIAVLKRSKLNWGDNDRAAYVVVTEDDNGRLVDFSYFSGPDALDRAIVFAGSDWYDGWADPENLAAVPTNYSGHIPK